MSSSTYFIVHQFINNQFTMSSDPFNTLEGAQEFMRLLEELSVSEVLSYRVYQCSPYGGRSHIHFSNSDEVEIQDDLDDEYDYVEDEDYVPEDDIEVLNEDGELEEPDLSEMTLREYGKGYLLECFEDDPYFGQKYFLDGFWNSKAEGWFFKADQVDYLESLGAFFEDELEEECQEEFVDEDLSTMTYRKYGKGYLLKAKKSDERRGIKYFLNGWWMPEQRGWFFKKEYKGELKALGARYKKAKA